VFVSHRDEGEGDAPGVSWPKGAARGTWGELTLMELGFGSGKRINLIFLGKRGEEKVLF